MMRRHDNWRRQQVL